MSQQGLILLANTFKNSVDDLLYSGNYLITEEIISEVKAIEKGVDKIKLDNNFLDSSEVWSQEANRYQNEPKETVSLINQGLSLMKDLKATLNRHSQGRRTDDQLRKDQYNSKSKLREFKEALNPYAYGADVRLENFSHYVGASNRLNNYRKHMTTTRNSENRWVDQVERKQYYEPQKQETRELQTSIKENTVPIRPYSSSVHSNSTNYMGPKTAHEVADVVFRKNHHLRRLNSAATNPIKIREYSNLSDKELIDRGIFAKYPDRSEYSYIYTKPKETEYISSFTINPQPNMKMFGRVFATAVPEPRFTEYQIKFQVPDGSKLERLPWLKK